MSACVAFVKLLQDLAALVDCEHQAKSMIIAESMESVVDDLVWNGSKPVVSELLSSWMWERCRIADS